jgi:hypothetical protein
MGVRGGPKCGNDDGFPTAEGGRDAKGANGGVTRGPVGGEKGVGDTATVAPFKGHGGVAWKGAWSVSGWCHAEERRRARCDVAGGGGGRGPGRGGGGPTHDMTRARQRRVERCMGGIWTGEAGA